MKSSHKNKRANPTTNNRTNMFDITPMFHKMYNAPKNYTYYRHKTGTTHVFDDTKEIASFAKHVKATLITAAIQAYDAYYNNNLQDKEHH